MSAHKEQNVAAQEQRRARNIEALGRVYNPSATKTQYRWRLVPEGKTRVMKRVPVVVSLSPSEQLNRARFTGRVAS